MAFSLSPKLKDTLQMLNVFPVDKFQLILIRIIEHLHEKTKPTFSLMEEEQLKTLFGISAFQLETLLSSCEYIFEQAAYYGITSLELAEYITEAGVSEQYVRVMEELWKKEGVHVIQRLSDSSSCSPYSLSQLNYKFSLDLGQGSKEKVANTTVLYDLTLQNPDNESTENIAVNFTHQELYKFFLGLEDIQQQLDALT